MIGIVGDNTHFNFIQPIDGSKPPPPLTSKGSYTSTSRATLYRKEAALRKAAAGSAKISDFFMHTPKDRNPTAKPAEVLEVSSSSEIEDEESPSDSDEDWVDIPDIPVSSPHVVAPVPNTPDSDMARTEPLSDVTAPNNASLEPAPTPLSFLDPTADDEFDPPTLAVGTLVARLIKEAKQHKSFAALFKLHAVRNYLELHERYRLVPNIKNPAMRASAVVAKSVGRGPYFARQIHLLVHYIQRFHTLPPLRAGKHQSHPSLLNNERVHQAVRRFLTILAPGEVSLFN